MAKKRKVLVVDDDSNWRDFLLSALDSLGYSAIEACSGEEALRALEEEDCSVILLDLHMPGMAGDEVVKRLPARSPRVVFMTSAPAEEMGKALRSGEHYYLPKGATSEQLSLILQSLEA